MALHFQQKGPYVLNSPIHTAEGQFHAIYHDSLKQLHDFARDYMDLSSSDFHTGDTAKGESPCYLLPQRLHSFAVRSGATPMALTDPHLKNIQGNLYIEISGNPAMGIAYQQEVEKDADEASAIASAQSQRERARRLNFYSQKDSPKLKAAIDAATAKRQERDRKALETWG